MFVLFVFIGGIKKYPFFIIKVEKVFQFFCWLVTQHELATERAHAGAETKLGKPEGGVLSFFLSTTPNRKEK